MHVARGPPFLHYYCAVVLHSCIVLPPVDHSSNHQYHCCQLTIRAVFRIFISLLRFSLDSPSHEACEHNVRRITDNGKNCKINDEFKTTHKTYFSTECISSPAVWLQFNFLAPELFFC
jgi:hypothetical protein